MCTDEVCGACDERRVGARGDSSKNCGKRKAEVKTSLYDRWLFKTESSNAVANGVTVLESAALDEYSKCFCTRDGSNWLRALRFA